MYTHLYRILLTSVLLVILLFFVNFFVFSQRQNPAFFPEIWKYRWFLLDGVFQILYLMVFLCVAWLWRPTENNERYGLDQLASDDYFEDEDLENAIHGGAGPFGISAGNGGGVGRNSSGGGNGGGGGVGIGGDRVSPTSPTKRVAAGEKIKMRKMKRHMHETHADYDDNDGAGGLDVDDDEDDEDLLRWAEENIGEGGGNEHVGAGSGATLNEYRMPAMERDMSDAM
jgi:hypothetical protein